jgi:hypothetical protein
MSKPTAHAGFHHPATVRYQRPHIVQGLLVQQALVWRYGLDERDYRDISRATLPLAKRLDRMVARDSRHLQIQR